MLWYISTLFSSLSYNLVKYTIILVSSNYVFADQAPVCWVKLAQPLAAALKSDPCRPLLCAIHALVIQGVPIASDFTGRRVAGSRQRVRRLRTVVRSDAWRQVVAIYGSYSSTTVREKRKQSGQSCVCKFSRIGVHVLFERRVFKERCMNLR